MKKIYALLLVVILCFVGQNELRCQKYSPGKDVDPLYKGWAGNPVNVGVFIDNSWDSTQKQKIRVAMNRWNAAGCKPQFVEVNNANDAKINVTKGPANQKAAGDIKIIYQTPSQKIHSATIIIAPNTAPLSLEEVATHEFGHSLGLDDTDPDDNPTDVMKGAKLSNGSNGNLSVHDKTQLKAAMGLSEKADIPKKKANNLIAIIKAMDLTIKYDIGIPVPPTSIPEVTSFDDDLIEINEVNIIGDELDISVNIDPSHGSGIFFLDIVIHLAPSPDTIEFIGYHYVHSNPVGPEIFQCPFIITESDGIVNIEWENMHSYPNSTIPLRSKLMVNDNLEFKTRPTGDYSISLDPGIYTFELHVDDYQVNSASSIMIFEVLGSGTGCEQPDNGSGTATLPPIGCDYTNTGDVFRIMDGLPPGTIIECNGTLKDFVCCGDLCAMCSLPLPPGECEMPGGTLGGTGHCFTANLEFHMVGTGALSGWERMVSIPVNGEAHSALRISGAPVQIFSTLFFTLNGQIVGDPDFDLLRITAGDSFGYPSPGQTIFTQLPNGKWRVDSFFDITYRIDFVGAPGGILAGLSGSTTSLVRVQTDGGSNIDWGDAPDAPYPTLAANNGANHMIVPGFCLGNSVDPEPDGQPDPNALGDDNDGNNDDDGVNFTSTITRGQPASFDVIASTPGFLNVWFDFDINGSWADAGEHMFQDAWLNPGLNSFALIVPQTSLPGTSFARFRFSSMPGLSFSGTAPDGEVEDYEISILDMPILDYDWGDAPDLPYPTKAINNGANHFIVPGFFLGNSIDPEPDGQPDPNALGDDNDGNNDDDGVIFNTPLLPGQPSMVTVIASAPGMLNAWFDYNKNGSWADPGEHVFMDFIINPGPNPLPFVIPTTTTSGNCFARFRFSGMPGLQFFGPAPDGEVEDYMIFIGSSIDDIPMDPDPLMTFVQNEISMAIVPSPTGGSPTALLAAYNDHPYQGGPGLGVSYSHDGGITWTPLQLPYPLNPLGIPFADAFDPTATSDGLGNLYAAHISTDYDWTNGPESGFYIHKSIDGGMTWNPPVQIAYDGKPIGSPDPNYRLNDRCQITCDINPASPYYNNLYAVWIKDRGWNMPLPYGDIYFSSSFDGGLTWSPQLILNGNQSNLANMPIPAVAPDGTIYVVWIDYNVITGGLGTIYIDFSFDGGLTWQTSDTQVGLPINLPPINLNGNTDVRAKGAAVVDVSPYNPLEVYIVYAEQIIGSPDEGDIFLIKSLDGGITWTIPLRVNDDLTFNDQVLPWMDVKQNGAIDIVWYDRRNDPADLMWDVYLATSLDGGNTFLQNHKINSVSAPSPQTPSGIWFGEYLGMVVDNTHAYIGFTSSVLDIKGDVFLAKKQNPSIDMDFGDTPDPGYPTLLVNDGARHILDGVTFLGTSVDPEPDGQPDPLALGDDNDGNNDDDGVIFSWPLLAGSPAYIAVTNSTNGIFNGWIDFDGDGTWIQPNEHIFVDIGLIPAGTHYLNFIVPPNAAPGISFARFRFSNQPALSYTGLASDGEVEDYQVMIENNPDIKWKQLPNTQYSGLHAHDYISAVGIHESIVLADDWLCQGGLVTDIHWWGNYEMQSGIERRGLGISHFHLSIHNDDPTGTCLPADPEIWGVDVPFSSLTEQFTGMYTNDGSPIYLYEYILPTPFNQVSGNRYWLDITAFSVDPNGNNLAVWRWQEAQRPQFPILCGAANKTNPQPGIWSTITWGSPFFYTDMAFMITSGEPMLDFGDLPDGPYPTLLVNNGPSHVVGSLFLGNQIDGEMDGQPHTSALGDDNNNLDDDDGVVFIGGIFPGQSAQVAATASQGNSFLQGWIDWNIDGDFNDAGEQIFTDYALPVGRNLLTFIVNPGANPGSTFARFRISSALGLGYMGAAPDGEVEDYEVIIRNPVAIWHFDENAGTIAYDATINQNNGTITGATWTSSLMGYALNFNGISDDVTVSHSLSLDITSQFSVQAWIRATGTSNYYAIVDKYEYNPAGSMGFTLYISSGKLRFSVYSGSAGNGDVFGTTELRDNTFHHVFASWDGSYIRAYVDGILEGEVPWAYAPASTSQNLGIGMRLSGWGGYMPFNGIIDEVIISADPPPAMDFGDASDPAYPTLFSSNGAHHILDGITYLGAGVDPDYDGQPNSNATGDDNDGNDDEDGVILPAVLYKSQPVNISVIASVNGVLNAWMDFDGNGSWGDPGEQIFVDQPLSAGTNSISFNIPLYSIAGATSARFRFSSVGGLTFTGLAQDGEVEDYMVVIDELPNKWLQYLDVNLPGLHAHDYYNAGVYQSLVLADDWICEGGWVTDIHWWGNYELDMFNQEIRGAGISYFHLSIHLTDPTGCLPLDPEIWSANVPFSLLNEQNSGILNNEGSIIYLYEYQLPNPFQQIYGTHYWLDVTSVCVDPNAPAHWRWQESGRDDTPILCGTANKIMPIPNIWSTITWLNNSYSDLAFMLTSMPVPELDMGDAPDPSYPTLLVSNGAAHVIDNFTYLGTGVDADSDGQPDPNALGDDNDGNDDEDGVALSPFTPSWTPGASVWLDITASTNGYLNAWVDFNANGSWGDSGEQILIDQLLSPGINGIIISVPANAQIGKTFARYRFSSVTGLSYTGLAPDGEVEDDEITIEGDVDINIKVFLEGPFTGTNMSTSLNNLGYLPLGQPYNSDPPAVWYYPGTESVLLIPNANITDWILVEFRDAPSAAAATRATMVSMQPAFILKDGSVVAIDGSSLIKVNGVFQYNPYVVIWHRNHLGVMSATPLLPSGINAYSYDFTTGAGQAYLNGQKNLGGGVYGMYGGDGAPNQLINLPDKTSVWAPQVGARGYKMGDFNMNGHVNNPDKNQIWVPNLGQGTTVP